MQNSKQQENKIFNNHPLHKMIGRELQNFKSEYCIILDEACDNNMEYKQQISLFINEKKRKNLLCKVDAMIIQKENNDYKVKVIIEIEESDFKPTTICGKYLTSALANNYSNKDGKSIHIPKNSLLFIQIVDSHKLLAKVEEKDNSKKHKQLNIIKDEIKKNQIGSIEKYELIFIDSSNPNFTKFKEVIKDYLTEIK